MWKTSILSSAADHLLDSKRIKLADSKSQRKTTTQHKTASLSHCLLTQFRTKNKFIEYCVPHKFSTFLRCATNLFILLCQIDEITTKVAVCYDNDGMVGAPTE